jgi:hypothetical protein
MASSIVWRRAFPDAAPGTDGVAIFDGRVIGRVQHMTNLPGDPKWSWSVTDPELAGRAGLGRHARRNALAAAGHGPADRALAGAAGL